MEDRFEKGIAFILEGDTEKVFYLALLNYLCKQHEGVIINKQTDPNSGEIFYTLTDGNHKVLIMFNVVGTISQITNSGNWFEKRCYNQHKNLEWTIFLCYDTDNYLPNISKFYYDTSQYFNSIFLKRIKRYKTECINGRTSSPKQKEIYDAECKKYGSVIEAARHYTMKSPDDLEYYHTNMPIAYKSKGMTDEQLDSYVYGICEK